VVICLERGADLHMTQLMPLPLTVSCFSKIQIGFTFLVPAHPGSPGQMAVKQHSETVMARNYENADRSSKNKFIVSLIVLFGTLSLATVRQNGLPVKTVRRVRIQPV